MPSHSVPAAMPSSEGIPETNPTSAPSPTSPCSGAEESLEQRPSTGQEEHYRRLVELSPDLVLLLDEEGIVRYANLASLDILRVTRPREVHGRSLEDFFADKASLQTREVVERIKTAGADTPLEEIRFRRMDQTWFYAELLASPFLHQGEHMTHLVVRDVTRRKEAEQARKKMRRRLLATVALFLTTLAAFGSYHIYLYTESTEFCGKFCHSVMGPDLALHQRSAHSQVSCAECHIGHGAAWYIKAKLSGFRQVYATSTGNYSRPIKTPIHNLRPAMETCEECHSGRVYYSNRDKVYFRFPAESDLLDPQVTLVRLHVGGFLPDTGKAVGIHWHAGHDAHVEYRTDDPQRLKIKELRVSEKGKTRRYVRADWPDPAPDTPWRTMDCTDCHNRVAHRYESQEEALDRLLFQGKLNTSLPHLKKAALEALSRKYPPGSEAGKGILESLESYYKSRLPDLFDRLRPSLAAEAQTLSSLAYRINVSMEMNIGWNNYLNLLGHQNELGCFRCHDDQHVGESGKTVSQSCDSCHDIPIDGVPLSRLEPAARALVMLRQVEPGSGFPLSRK